MEFRRQVSSNSILITKVFSSTGYTMWVPTMTNAYFNGEDNDGKTFCEVASKTASENSVCMCSYSVCVIAASKVKDRFRSNPLLFNQSRYIRHQIVLKSFKSHAI